MNIMVIGGSRGIGKEVVSYGLDCGHHINVVARYPEKIKITHPELEVVKGDIRDPESIRHAIERVDVVCSCIGTGITFSEVTLFSEGARTLVALLKDRPEKRLIAITGIGAGDSKGHGGFLYDRVFKPLFLKTIYADKDLEESLIKDGLENWLIVRPAGLTNGARTGDYRVITDYTGVTAKRISRKDVAQFMIEQAEESTLNACAPLLTY